MPVGWLWNDEKACLWDGLYAMWVDEYSTYQLVWYLSDTIDTRGALDDSTRELADSEIATKIDLVATCRPQHGDACATSGPTWRT